MTLFFYLDGVDVSSRVRLTDSFGLSSLADHGEVGIGSLILDDPDGNLTINGWRPFYVEETDCTAQPRLFTGYIGSRRIRRHNPSDYTSTARVHDCDIVDLNFLLSLKVARGSDAKRPYETETARMSWLLDTSTALAGLVFDNGLVDTSGGQSYDEADFRGQYAGEVLASMASTGKNFYAYRDHPTGEPSLYWAYGSNYSSLSTLRVSNDYADYDGTTTFLPYRDAELSQEPFETYSGIYLSWVGGITYDSLVSTASNYIARDVSINSSRIGRLQTAVNQAARYLSIHSVEYDRILCTVLLPSTKVGLIEAGNLLQVRFTHLPGYTDWTWSRVISCDVRLFPSHDEQYELRLELSVAPKGGGPGGGGDFPVQPPTGCTPSTTRLAGTPSAFTISATTPANPENINDDNIATASVTANGVAGGGSYAHGWDMDLGSAKTLSSVTMYGEDGWFEDAPTGTGGRATHTSGGAYGRTYTYQLGYSDDGSAFTYPLYDWTFGGDNFTITNLQALGSHRYWRFGHFWTMAGLSFYEGIDLLNEWYLYECVPTTAEPPAPGQWVYYETVNETPDGSIRTFTVDWPYADGTLTVYVDRLDQTAAVTSYDGAAKSFTLAFAPETGELVEASYKGR